jgi:drug/metabolite transporter (DMT)-like permease
VAALAPIFVVFLSILFLKEVVEKKIWFAILIGFVGVIVILRPGFDVFSVKSLLPLGAGFFFGFGYEACE